MAAVLLLLLLIPSGWAAAVIARADAPLFFKCIWAGGLVFMVTSLTVLLLPRATARARSRKPLSAKTIEQHIAHAYIRQFERSAARADRLTRGSGTRRCEYQP